VNLEDICRQVIDLTQHVGEFILQEAAAFDLSRIEYKGKNNLVSYVDQEAERQLVKGLQKILPEAGFITEEGTTSIRSETTNWIIDPLDGTTNFIHGVPVFAISVALMHEGQVVAGVVLELNRNECFYAWKDGGAYRNGHPIRVSPLHELEDSLLVTGFPYVHADKMDQYVNIFKEFLHLSHGVRRLGSAATDLAYVACGRFEAFYEYNLNAWDVAAGVLLVHEAGGTVTDFTGGEEYLFGGKLIAANSATIREQVQTVIGKHWTA
jgi:myo-inositol-1(or 4)-monophosphatase